MTRDFRSLGLPVLSLLPWATLQLWPGLLLHIPGGLGPWPYLASPVAVLLAAAGAASLLARLDLTGWWLAAFIPVGVFARLAMGYLDAGPAPLRSFLTVVLIGVAARAFATSFQSESDEIPATSSNDASSTVKGTSKKAEVWGKSKRVLAMVMASPYLLLTPLLVLYFIMGAWEPDGTYGLAVGIGTLWALGLPGLAIFYALRPFRFGFLLVAVLSLVPAAYVGWAWYGWDRDPQVLESARSIAERYVEDPVYADTTDLAILPDERVSRLVGDALLDLAQGMDGDPSRRRIATGLMAAGKGRRAERYLWDLMQETEGDPERAELHALARKAYDEVWSRRSFVGVMWALWTKDDRMPAIDGP